MHRRSDTRLRSRWGAAAIGLLVLAGCGDEAPPKQDAGLTGEVTVSAAASLTESFTEIGERFEAANPGTEVTFTFDSSGRLANQILEGAPVDVFASADEPNLAAVADEGLTDGEAAVFARNQLVIVTQPGNPDGIEGLADLARVGVVALCAIDAPCGTFATQVLDDAEVRLEESSVTRGQNAKATLTAVSEGDAVAAVVYATDAAAAGDAVETVGIPDHVNVIARYPIAILDDAADTELAAAFVDYVTSEEGRAILEARGFLPPT